MKKFITLVVSAVLTTAVTGGVALAASTPPKDDAVIFTSRNPIDDTVSIVFDYKFK